MNVIDKESLVGDDGCGWSAVLTNEKNIDRCPGGDNFIEGVWNIWRTNDVMTVDEMYGLRYQLAGKNNWVQACHVRRNVRCIEN